MGNNETPLALREPLADHANRGDIYTISISLAIYVTLAWDIQPQDLCEDRKSI